jgi:hypothetical protein
MKAMTPGEGLGIVKFSSKDAIPEAGPATDRVKTRMAKMDHKNDERKDRAMDSARLRDVLKKNRETKVRRQFR